MRRAALVVLVLGALLAGALAWPLPLYLGEHVVHDTFSGSHAWASDHVFQSLFGERSLSPTSAAGYPYVRFAPFIGWLNNLFTWPLRPLFGPLGAFQLVHLLSLALTAVATLPLLRRWTDADPWICAAAALAFAFCPYLLSTLAIGETPKLQAWGFPLFLWAAQRWMDGRWTGALLGGLIALGLGFTSPYYGMALPLIIGVFCLVSLVRAQGWAGRAWALAPLVWTALALLPVYAYFGGQQHVQQANLMKPAMAGETGTVLPSPHPVATPADLLLGAGPVERGAFEIFHVSYLGLPLLVLALLLLLLAHGRAKGTGPGLALLLGGVLLAMGPNLAYGGHFTAIPLPASLLAWAGYPYVRGGMWFRLVVIAALGLSVLLAAGAARLRHGRWLAWAVLALHVADGVRDTGPWPLVVQPLPGRAQLEAMRAAGSLQDGAVLHFPLQEGIGLAEGQRMLVAAAVHGRPTTALARELLPVESSAMRAMVAQALDAPDPAAALRALGFRYVVHQPMQSLRSRVSQEELARKLGPGQGSALFMSWDLGPTTLAPQRRLPGQMGPTPGGPPR
ncbi:MAG: hypothetical protein H6741_05215 [Alphaproteobacteria bacterium]|nr:hypothetical protein [Alphaproteobacteria bacterium]MCB9792106.1 hypothetical protein [Alphaproteobacteria bacterium]